MRKIKFTLFVLCIFVSSIAHAFDFSAGNGYGVTIYYNIIDGGCEVTGVSHAFEYSGEINIPSMVYHYPSSYSVIRIGERAFYNCSGLSSVTIPNSVTTIGEGAFGMCSDLTSVTIPNSVTDIGNWAFEYCSNLASVTIPNSVVSIGDYAFYGCSGLTSITIGNSVTTIGGDAFLDCSSLTSVTIPNSVTTIGEGAFKGCSSLTSITIPNSVTSIGGSAFRDCSGLTSVTIGNSVVNIGEIAFSGCDNVKELIYADGTTNVLQIGLRSIVSVVLPNSVISIDDDAFRDCSNISSIVLPSSLVSIGDYAFQNCDGLSSVTLPNSLVSIGDYAFEGCDGLTSIIIPASVNKIGVNPFRGCEGLTSVIVSDANNVYDSRENCNAIIEKITNTLIVGCNNAKIPTSVSSIGEYAFFSCSGLASITIPESVTSICNYAFSGCSGLASITIPESVTSICNYAFSGCSGVSSINFPNYLTNIGDAAFLGCSGIISITIPNSVKNIGRSAFQNCSALTSATISGSVISIGELVFDNCSELTSIVVSEDNKVYDSRENCNAIIETSTNTLISGCKNTIIPSSVYVIGDKAFRSCRTLTSITIPNSVIRIGDSAFQVCSDLTSVVLPKSLESIGENAFSKCSKLADVYCFASEPPSVTRNSFYVVPKNLHVKRGSKELYASMDYWKKFTIIDDLLLDERLTDISDYENILYFNSTTTHPGKQVTIPLMLNNVADITAMQFDLVLPDGVTLDKNAKGNYAIKFNEETERTDAMTHTLVGSQQADGSIRILSYSNTNDIFSGNSGAVIDLPITIDENIMVGEYPIILENIVLTAKDKTQYKIDRVVCLLEIPEYELGDANGDDEINVTDIVYTSDYILGHSDSNFNVRAADMNDDDEINVTDIVYIADIILTSNNSNGARSSQARGMSRAAGESTMSIAPFSINPGESKTVTLDMYNPGREVTAFQFDLYLPDGLTIDKNAKGKFKLTFDNDTERTDATCHTLSASQQDNGSITFLCYSVDMDTFAGEEGAVVDIPFTASSTMPDGEYDIRLENILMTCADKSEIKPGTTTVKVKVGTTSSISDMSAGNTPTAVYSINGQRKEAMNRGINIVRMSNGAVKKIAK